MLIICVNGKYIGSMAVFIPMQDNTKFENADSDNLCGGGVIHASSFLHRFNVVNLRSSGSFFRSLVSISVVGTAVLVTFRTMGGI